jgi:hypothetical protein
MKKKGAEDGIKDKVSHPFFENIDLHGERIANQVNKKRRRTL